MGSPPIVVNDVVYVAGMEDYLYALDPATGTLVNWQYVAGGFLILDEDLFVGRPLLGLGAGGGLIVVGAKKWLIAYH